jgi:CheY-like chemotaxis protein
VIDVLAVSTDLFFASRIRSAASAAACTLQFVSSVETAGAQAARLALVDLDAALDISTVIRTLKASGVESVVAFGPHLDTARRKAARQAGADRVLAKSKFVTELPHLLATASGQTAPE